MSVIGDLVVNFSGNTQAFDRASGRVTRGMSNLGRTAKQFAGALAGAFAVRSSVNVAREQIASERKLSAVLSATGNAAGFSAKQITEYAQELQSVTNFGDEATISAAAVLATFKNIKGDQFKDALAIAQDMSAVFGQDMKASVIQVGKALDNPIAGASALKEIGVSLSDAEINRVKTLQEQGDLVEAQKVLFNALTTQVGGAAEAMADPMTQMENKLKDVSETFGMLVVEMFNSATAAYDINEGFATVDQTIKDIGLALKKVAVVVTDVFKGVGDMIGTMFANIAHDIGVVSSPLSKLLSGELPSMADIRKVGEQLVNPLEGFQFEISDIDKIKLDVFEQGKQAPTIAGFAAAPVTETLSNSADDLADKVKKATTDTTRREQQFAEAATQGSQEAISSILQNQFKRSDTNEKKIEKNTSATVEQLQRLNTALAGLQQPNLIVEAF